MTKSASLKSFAIGGLVVEILLAIASPPFISDGILFPIGILILPLGLFVLIAFVSRLVRAIRTGSNDAHRQAVKFGLSCAIWLCAGVLAVASALALLMIDPWDNPDRPIPVAELIPLYLWAMLPIFLIVVSAWIYWRWTLKRVA